MSRPPMHFVDSLMQKYATRYDYHLGTCALCRHGSICERGRVLQKTHQQEAAAKIRRIAQRYTP